MDRSRRAWRAREAPVKSSTYARSHTQKAWATSQTEVVDCDMLSPLAMAPMADRALTTGTPRTTCAALWKSRAGTGKRRKAEEQSKAKITRGSLGKATDRYRRRPNRDSSGIKSARGWEPRRVPALVEARPKDKSPMPRRETPGSFSTAKKGWKRRGT
jgi:hypothetical protein